MSIEARKTKNGTVYDVRYRVTGNSEQRCKTFNRMSDARDFSAIKTNELMQQRLGISNIARFDGTTLREEALFWLEQKEVELSGNWYGRASAIIHKTLLPKYGHLTPDKFTISFIRKLQSELKSGATQKRGVKRYKNATINRMTEVICAILNYSAKTRRIPFNPASGYEKLPDDKVEMSYWETDEVKSFLKFVGEKYPKGHEDRWVYVVMLVALNCGLRAGEIWGLQPGDIKEQSLFIKRQWSETQKKFDLPKGKRNRKAKDRLPYRHVVLHQMVKAELLDVIKHREVKSDETIFYGTNRQPRGHVSFRHRFNRLVRDWRGKRIRFHDLRHTAITLWVHAGINLRVIQEMAGHESITTTMGYVHMVGGSVQRVSQFHLVNEAEVPQGMPEETRLLPESFDEMRMGSA